MNDIKKKFYDILFEPDEQEVQADAPLKDIKEKIEIIKKTEVSDAPKSPNAKDILYGKQDKASSFIDYFEVPKVEKKTEIKDESYEMRDNVSPIFGPIVQKERKKKPANEKEIQKAITNTSTNEYIGIVLSPIYGYDVSKANDARKALDRSSKKEEYIEEDELFSSAEPAFDIPEDMKETIEEAVKEAVVELNTMETPAVNQDIVEDEVINKPIYEEEIIEDYDEVPNDDRQYEYEEPIVEEVADTYEDVTNEDLYQEIETHTSEYEKIDDEVMAEDIEEYQEKENTYQENIQEIEKANDDFSQGNYEEQSSVEDTTNLSIDDALSDIRQATRSIYDTTPIQLFDYDEVSDSKDSDKDLFDELIGDDD